MKLGDVATVRSGLVLSRKQAREAPGKRYPLLNLRSINSGGYIDVEQLDVFTAEDHLSPEYLAQVGDVILRLTAPYTAVLINETTAGMVVSSNFVIIRTEQGELLPEYLYWLLNTRSVKREIYENTSSNMLGAIKAKYFSELEIPPLSIIQQQQLADLNTLALKETMLLRKLATEKEHYYGLLMDRIHEEMKRGN